MENHRRAAGDGVKLVQQPTNHPCDSDGAGLGAGVADIHEQPARKTHISLSQGSPARPLNLLQSKLKPDERTSSAFPIN